MPSLMLYPVKKIATLFRKLLGLRMLFKNNSHERFVTVHDPNIDTVIVYVGEEKNRYEVPEKYFSYPIFEAFIVKLLRESGQEFDCEDEEPLMLPCCSTDMFDQLLKHAKDYFLYTHLYEVFVTNPYHPVNFVHQPTINNPSRV